MASTITILLLISLLLQKCTISNGSTHWIVTEDGRIQSQPDSVYNLRRPYDLVAFMKQEDRAAMLNDLKKELLNRKDEIDKNEDRDTGLEQKFYKTNPDCIEAGKPLPEFDLYISTVLPLENKGIRPEEHIDINGSPSPNPRAPDCTAFMSLDFSMHAFEHLEGMKARHNLSGTPELGLKNAITHRENVDDYGHLVFEALNKNNTSWILYNMAAFYWRIKGNPYQAVECIRRALHHSPRYQKDVALISLANILHRAKFSNEAAILVHAALEVSKELNVNHFTLGNIYAVLGEYNKSIICFENTLKIQPDFEAAAKRRHAVLCHSKLEMALEAQHRSLQRTLKDLKDYQRKHDMYQTQSDKLLAEQVPHEVKVAQHYAYEQLKMRERSTEMDEHCRMVEREGKQVLLCTWSRRSPTLDFDFEFRDEALEKKQDENADDADPEPADPESPDYSQPSKAPLYSKLKKHKPSEADSYKQVNWPKREECDSMVKKVPDPRNLTTIYLSPENKGFEVKELLTQAQGLEPNGEHPLPWYPPVCVPLMELAEGNTLVYDHLKSVSYAERSRIPLKYNDPSMKTILLNHVNEGSITEEEVGQRILTALKQKIGPQWILYNLAGLYWRIIGNNYHGIECIRRSIYLSPPQYKDIPLVNLANILYRYGRYDDAVTIMRDALAVNDAEPSSHFFFGHLLWATRNYTGAAFHYEEALAYEPSYTGALDALRAMKCYLKFHHAAQSAAPQESSAGSHSNNCHQKSTETESRVICKAENSEEKCIIETRSRNRVADCNGQCTQTCTITPIKMDGCSGDVNLENAIDPWYHPLEDETEEDFIRRMQFGQGFDEEFNRRLLEDLCPFGQCSGKGGKQFSTDQDDMLFSADFTSKLDEVSDYYQKKGLCEGDECSHLRVQCLLPMSTHSGLLAHVITPPKLFVRPVAFHAAQCLGSHKPHTKLEYVDGVLRHKLLFLQIPPSEMQVDAEDCIIFNDGTKSAGCNREEFRTYIEDLEHDISVLEGMLASKTGGHVECSLSGPEDQQIVGETINFEIRAERRDCAGKVEEKNRGQKADRPPFIKANSANKPVGVDGKHNEKVEEQDPVQPYFVDPHAQDYEGIVKKVETNPGQKLEEDDLPPLEDDELPDVRAQLGRLGRLKWKPEDCGNEPYLNMEKLTSAWIPLSDKGIDISEYIDFKEDLTTRNSQLPLCSVDTTSPIRAMEHLPSVRTRLGIHGFAEHKLKSVIEKLGGEVEEMDIVGTRIARAMKLNSTSWVAYHYATLYWRTRGNTRQAMECVRMALTYAPTEFRSIVLVSLANIQQTITYHNDAIVSASAALDLNKTDPMVHFTLGNLFVAKKWWNHALMFFHSTLELDPNFRPAQMRIESLMCQGYVTEEIWRV